VQEGRTVTLEAICTRSRELDPGGKGRKKRISTQPSRIDASRDVDRVRQRYLLQPKADLVERLLAVEYDFAVCQQQLAQLQFEMLAFQQQLEEARQPRPTKPKSQGRNTSKSPDNP
jgi:hypothetical protein